MAERVIGSALQALPLGKCVSVAVSPSPVRVRPKHANELALVISELTTNSVKYAAQRPGGSDHHPFPCVGLMLGDERGLCSPRNAGDERLNLVLMDIRLPGEMGGVEAVDSSATRRYR